MYFLFIFSNLGKGEGERDNNTRNIIHKSSCDDLQSVYFISKLFPITRKDFFKIHFYTHLWKSITSSSVWSQIHAGNERTKHYSAGFFY